MDYIELSLHDLKKISYELASIVDETYKPDLVLFIAKGGYLIGKHIGDRLNIPIVPVYAERKTNSMKTMISPILKLLPKPIKLLLRKLELKSGVHSTIKERNISFPDSSIINILSKSNHLLIVDDSIDTGGSIISILNEIDKLGLSFIDIRVAVLNLF